MEDVYLRRRLQRIWDNSAVHVTLFFQKEKKPFFSQLFERASENGAFPKAWKKKVT